MNKHSQNIVTDLPVALVIADQLIMDLLFNETRLRNIGRFAHGNIVTYLRRTSNASHSLTHVVVWAQSKNTFFMWPAEPPVHYKQSDQLDFSLPDLDMDPAYTIIL